MGIRVSGLATFLCGVAGCARPSGAQVDQQRAQVFFNEAQALCERDGGRLWGVPICAPMVFADRRTQTIATSQPAPEGERPRLLGLVNAPIQWGGARWGAYVWDDVVSRTPRERHELLLHELFHGVQPQLGLPGAPALGPEHLDAANGRYWLRLEWRALARALPASGEQRTLAIRDAAVIPDIGTVYFGPYRASGGWGTLEAEQGVLVASDGRSRRVSGPVRHDDGTFGGDGWTFKAAPGWVVREGARPGDFEVVRQP